MDLGLKDRVAVVTGGSRGIGKGIALGLASEGVHIAICARGESDLRETENELRAKGVKTLAVPLDITLQESAEKLFSAVMGRFGQIDILVNNAGGNRRGLFASMTNKDWMDIVELNLLSHARITRAMIPQMRVQGCGVILFIASIYGRESGGTGVSIYNTTKSGVISMAKVMAAELAPHNIRVNSIAPGSILFPGGEWEKRLKRDPKGMAEFVRREMPMRRFGTVEEVANIAVFLASERASLVCGACINVDGCQSHSLI
jgi:3-oxoacyl-[acyl-carrier protein] reductase